MSGVSTKLRIGTWNTKWARPRSARGNRVSADLADPECDILCVTEGGKGILPANGHPICGGADWGYPPEWEGCRKVLLWSRWPWSRCDTHGSDALPPGRFVAGVTDTPLGSVTVVGVCIPWFNAHVKDGHKNRERWEDHERWLDAFETLTYRYATERTVVLGDFNQRIPWTWGKKQAQNKLMRALENFTISTNGDLPGAPHRAIDHIAHTPDVALVGDIELWPKRRAKYVPLSDHFGVWGDFALS